MKLLPYRVLTDDEDDAIKQRAARAQATLDALTPVESTYNFQFWLGLFDFTRRPRKMIVYKNVGMPDGSLLDILFSELPHDPTTPAPEHGRGVPPEVPPTPVSGTDPVPRT